MKRLTNDGGCGIGAMGYTLLSKVNEIVDWINKHEDESKKDNTKQNVNRPKVLYALEDIETGEIIFNARGGAYQDYESVVEKLCKLGTNDYKIVKYSLEDKKTKEHLWD